MSDNAGLPYVERITDIGGREAVVLEHDSVRVMIDDIGGMVPELSYKKGRGRLNAHWLPWFRSNSGKPFGAADAAFWKAGLLYHIAGTFPCAPNFGGDNNLDGMVLPPHGWTANLTWRFQGGNADHEAAWAVSTMQSPEPKLPLFFKKIDAVVSGHAVHYTSLEIANKGGADLEVCAAWHNTAGTPFLQNGCRISGAANRWITAPKGGEFDATARLAFDAEFASLDAAPLASGGTADISIVPGPIGYTDFACGVIPASASLGWSALVNPGLKMAYVCFFTGEAGAAEDDIILRFNDLWMQYGGRFYTPWAPGEGASDMTYCLGTENSVSGYALGLQSARERKQLMGAPTTVCIPAGKSRVLRYGTFFGPYEGGVLDNGVSSAEDGGGLLALAGKNGAGRFTADPSFGILKKIEAREK
jgi:hypothetical protein